jgi:hypothetical protein
MGNSLRQVMHRLANPSGEFLPQSLFNENITDVHRKSRRQKLSRFALRHTSTSQVKERLGLKLPDGRPVGGFDVVGVNLKLWLGVDLSGWGKKQSSVEQA